MTNRHKTRICRACSWIITGFLISALCPNLSGQQLPEANQRESSTYRTIGLLAGGGGGFTLGLFAGLAAFDDDLNSDRKLWTAALLSAAGGAVGGYFLGRHFDKKRSQITWIPDQLDRSLAKARFQNFEPENEELSLSLRDQAGKRVRR